MLSWTKELIGCNWWFYRWKQLPIRSYVAISHNFCFEFLAVKIKLKIKKQKGSWDTRTLKKKKLIYESSTKFNNFSKFSTFIARNSLFKKKIFHFIFPTYLYIINFFKFFIRPFGSAKLKIRAFMTKKDWQKIPNSSIRKKIFWYGHIWPNLVAYGHIRKSFLWKYILLLIYKVNKEILRKYLSKLWNVNFWITLFWYLQSLIKHKTI